MCIFHKNAGKVLTTVEGYLLETPETYVPERTVMLIRKNILLIISLLFVSVAHSSGQNCTDPKAVPFGTSDQEMDGFFIGANNCAYNPLIVSSDEVPAVGQEYSHMGEPIFMVNGANGTVVNSEVRIKSVSISKQRPVIGIFNAPADLIGEINKFVDFRNNAAETIRQETFSRVLVNRTFTVIGLSQAGFIVSHGLVLLKKDLIETFPYRYRHRKKLLKLVGVETVGAIALYFPNGPNYVHYVNKRDILPLVAGMGSNRSHPGRGAVIASFYYYNKDCDFGILPLDKYPGVNAVLSKDKSPVFSAKVHSLCSYAATGFDFDSLRNYAPRFGYTEIELDLGRNDESNEEQL